MTRTSRPLSLNVLAREFREARDGNSSVEFAVVLPLLLLLLLGSIEISRAVSVQRSVAQIASSAADLAGRAEEIVPVADLADIMQIGGYLLGSASKKSLTIRISSVTSSASDAERTTERWRCDYSGSANQTTCTCPNTPYKLDTGNLVVKSDSVVLATVTYQYSPLGLHEAIEPLERMFGSGLKFTFTRFVKPRTQAARLRFTDNKVC